ncbi:MAG: M48 family metallopeptidase [Saprospiraceae bacterium]|nr:M48 family metallopeptidase [Saprospiraceae bacterium]
MTKQFTGSLHRQPEKTQRPVNVRLEPGAIVILGEYDTQRWLASDLSSSRLVSDGSVILQNGPQFLDVRDPAFAEALEQALGTKRLFRRSFFDKIGLAGCLLSILLVVLPLVAGYIWLLPFLADKAAKKVSPEMEKEIGENWYKSLTADYTIDTARTRLVQQFYAALDFEGEFPIQITVVQEPVVNAFAVPGGHIVVFDSIIRLMDAPEQLAGLLAHEASHVQLHHSTRAIFRDLANSLFFSLLVGDYGGMSGVIAQHGGQLAGLSYSRNLEQEADEHGLALMGQSHIPLRGMPDLFKKMNASVGEDSGPPTFLSTHPAMKERIEAAEKWIAAHPHSADSVPADLGALWSALRAL